MYRVSTTASDDGVIGLNGKQYLLDNNDELMLFKSIDEAREFLEDNGEDPDNEYMDYEEHIDINDELMLFKSLKKNCGENNNG